MALVVLLASYVIRSHAARLLLAFTDSILQELPAPMMHLLIHSNVGAPVLGSAPCDGGTMETNNASDVDQSAEQERLAYSVQEAADLPGVDYFSVYQLIQRCKLRACRVLRGNLLVPRTELLRILKDGAVADFKPRLRS